jgi:hypothetical protein
MAVDPDRAGDPALLLARARAHVDDERPRGLGEETVQLVDAHARHAAIAMCEGSPLRSEIEARGPGRLAEAVDRCSEALARRYGSGAIDGKIQALVVEVAR